MSDFVSMNLKGGKELEKTLLAMEKKVAKKVVRRGVRKGLKPTLTAAKANVASMLGGRESGGDNEVSMKQLLKDNLVIKVAKKQRKGSYKMAVQPRADVAGFVDDKNGYYIPFAIEYGHAFPGRGGGKNAPKDVPAIPFMRKAADANLKKAVPILAREINRGIEAVARSK
jgi:HK97 gp10 family phage protein